MCLGGGGSRSPIYQTYNYPAPDTTPRIPTPVAPDPIPETVNPSIEKGPQQLDKRKTTQAGSPMAGSLKINKPTGGSTSGINQ